MPFKKKYHCLEDVLQNTERTASGCMLWKGGMHRTGYPACSAYGLFKSQALHREVHRLATGESPEVVMHTCDTPSCINPAHLKSGTAQQNKDDAVQKRRHAYGARNGRAKLDAQRVRCLKEDRRKGETYAALAHKYGVAEVTVWRVLTEQNWRS